MKINKKTLLAGASLLMVAALPVLRADIITSNTTILGAGAGDIRDGAGGNGYLVQSGTLTINNLTLSNYAAQGGAGSGGGAGLGGGVFVNNGASVVLTNVNLLGNQAVGGNANILITTGGSLNGLYTDPSAATPGLAGTTPGAEHYLDPNGTTGTNGGKGANSTTGLGGLGGNGGAGGPGDAEGGSAPYIIDVTSASLAVAATVAQIAGASQPFTASEIPGLVLQAAQNALDLGNATAALVLYDKAIQSGQLGVGGDGGTGGNAGYSGFGFGGVKGGAGGAGGAGTEERTASAFNGGAAGGNGGDGGEGGIGGFGAGGGAGGNGGAGGAGAQIGAMPAVPAVAATTQVVDTAATYEAGYFWDDDANVNTPKIWVQTKAGLGSNPATETGVSVTPPDGSASITVDIVGRELTPARTDTITLTPAQDAIPATSAGSRPDGAAGAGGAGGAAGFGAGNGAGGSGSNTRAQGGDGGSGFGGAVFVADGGSLTIAGDATFDGNDVRGGAGQAGSSTVVAGAAGTGIGTDMFMMAGATVTLSPGIGKTITFNGSIADDSATSGFSGPIPAGGGAGIAVTGGGTVVFNGTNTYSGATVVTGGTVLQAIDGVGVNAQSHLSLSGGSIFQSSGSFSRRLGNGITQLEMGDSSGFAAAGGRLQVSLNSGGALVWASTSKFVTGTLTFGSDTADSTVDFTNAINLNGGTRTVWVTDNTGSLTDIAALSGVLSNGGLTVGNATHTGVLRLDANNTYAGGTTVSGGTLALSGTGYLLSSGAITVDSAFDISGAGDRSVGTLSGASTGLISLGSHTLTVNQGDDATFAGTIADGGLAGGVGGGFTKAGANTLTLSGASTYTGPTTVSVGTLVLSGSLASTSVTIASGATLTDTAGGLVDTAVVTANGAFTLTADETIKTLGGSGSVALGGALTVSDGAFAGVVSGNSNLNKTSAGTLTLSGANTFLGAANVNAGTLNLTGSLDTLAVNVDSGATLLDVNGGLASGATLTNAGNVTLSADDAIAAYVSTGTLDGAGKTLTAATYALNGGSVVNANLGTGVVTANGIVAINGTSSASTHNIVTGTTTLGSAERLIDTTTVAISSGAKLVLGGAETIQTLNGVGTLDNNAGALTVSQGNWYGDITGVSAVNKTSANMFTVAGANTFTGAFNVNAGLAFLTTAGSLATHTVNVATGATLFDMGGGLAAGATLTNDGMVFLSVNDSISAYVSTGMLSGGATLTADTYALNGGSVVGANLGTGAITANGAVSLSGTANAETLLVATGTTTLVGSERLVDTMSVTIASGATLTLGGVETIQTLNGAGTLNNNSGPLTVSNGDWNGDITGISAVNKVSGDTLTISGANTFSGAFNANAGTTTLVGSLATNTVNIASGATLRDINGGLAAGATVTNAGTLDLAASDETITAFVSNGGTLNFVQTYTPVLADGPDITVVNPGTQILIGVNPLTGEPVYTTTASTTTTLSGPQIIVGSTANAPSKLTALTYALNDGTVINANLGTGTLTANGAVALNGTSDAGTHNIVTGTTTLGAAERLIDTTTVDISSGAKLVLGGAETVKTLNGAGTLDNNAGALTVSDGAWSGDITGGSAVNKVSSGTLTVSGANTFTGAFNANDGTTILTGSGSLATAAVNVAVGATFDDLNGGLVPATVLTNDGTVNLGADETITTLNGTAATAAVNLGANTLTVSDGAYAGAVNGTGTLTKTTTGTLTLSGTSGLTGTFNVGAGTVDLTGSIAAATVTVSAGATLLDANDGLAANAVLNNHGTVTLGANETITTLNGAATGVVNLGANTLTVSDGVYAGAIEGAGNLVKNTAGTLTLSGTSGYTGTTDINAGTVELTGSIGSLFVNVASGAFLNDVNGGLAAGATLTNAGTVTLSADESIDTYVSNGGVLNVSGYTLTTRNYLLNDGSVTNADLGTGSVTTNGDVTVNGTSDAATFTVATGTTTLGAAERLNDTGTVVVSGGATLVLGGAETVGTLNGAGTLDNDAGALTVSAGVWSGDITGVSAVNKGSAGTLTLSGANTFTGAFNANAGTTVLSGSLATTTVNIASGATFDDVNGGLVAAAVVTADGAFVLRSDETITTLNGASTGSVELNSNTLTLSDGTFAGAIGGTGGLVKNTAGTLTLSGTSGYTGTTAVNSGTLTLTGSIGSLAVNVASGAFLNDVNGGLAAGATLTNAGTVTLSADDTVSAYVSNAGVLAGIGQTLTATTYALNDGSVVNANLGAGAVTANGAVTLNGASSAATFTVATGTTTLGAAERLVDTMSVTIASGAHLVLGGAETIGSLNGAGVLNNTAGTFTVSSGAFAGDITGGSDVHKVSTGTLTLAGANTFTGLLSVDAGRLTLTGSLATNFVNVASGSTLDDVNAGLASGATLTNAGTVNVGLDDTINVLNNTGTLNGPGTLTASQYNLGAGSVINANLGTGTLVITDAVILNGASAASVVDITPSGTLTLGLAERLNDTAAVNVNGALILGGAETIGSLTGAGGVNLSAGALTVSSGDFSGVLSGANGLNKVSAGTLTLSGTNTFAGAANVNAGTLKLTGSLDTLAVNVASGATLLDVNGGLASGATLTNAGNVTLSVDDTITAYVSTGTLDGAGKTLTAATYALNGGSVVNANLGAGIVTANGLVAINGTSSSSVHNIVTGTTTLGSAERLIDTTTVNVSTGATLVLGGAETVRTLNGAGTVLTAASAQLTVSDGAWAGNIAGDGGLTKVSGGTLALSGANTYTGDTRVDAGLVVLTGSIAGAPVSIASGATLDDRSGGLADTTRLTLDGTLNLYASETFADFSGAATGRANLIDGGITASAGNFAGVITGDSTQFGITKVSGDTLTLSGANTFIGTATVSAGTLVLSGSFDTASVTVADGATLDDVNAGLADATVLTAEGAVLLRTAETVKTLRSTGSTGVVSLLGGSLTVSNGDYAGVIAGTDPARTLQKVSVGELTLRGANTFAGETHVAGGVLTLTGSGSLASTLVTIEAGTTLRDLSGGLADTAVVVNRGTLDIGSLVDDTIGSLVNSGTIAGTRTLTAATYALNSGSAVNANLGEGVVTANGTVAINGTVAAATVNIVTGTTSLGSSERLADTATVTISSGATLATGGAEQIGTLLGAGRVIVTAGTLAAGSGNFSGVIASDNGTTGLTKTGPGVLTLSGASTYQGLTTVSGGELVLTGTLASRSVVVASAGTLTSASGGLSGFATLVNDGVVNLGATDRTLAGYDGAGTLNGTATLTAATYALRDGAIVNANLGAGTLQSDGATLVNGTVAAGTVNILTGTTTLGSAERLADSAAITVNTGATLVLGGVETVNTLGGSGTVDTGAGTLVANGGNFGGDITGASGLVKTSAGTLTLSGTNTFTGPLELSGGTLALTGSLATDTVNIRTGTMLADLSGGLSSTSVVLVDGVLAITAPETIGDLAGLGVVSLSGGDLTVGSGTFAGNIDGTGTLAKSGAGTLTLSGANTLAGNVLVSEGELTLTGSLASPLILVDTAGTFADVSGGLTDAAVIMVNGGALRFGANETLAGIVGGGTASIANGTTLAVGSGSYSGEISGAGSFTKTGTGTLTLSGANTYTGPTAVNAGTLQLAGSLVSTGVSVASGATLESTASGLSTATTLTNAGTLNLGSANQTVLSLNNAGTINGSATLTAATYALNDGAVVSANLGSGSLVASGNVVLAGTSAAQYVTVNAGAVLTLVSADRLADYSEVTVEGRLFLAGGDDTISKLFGSGVIDGGSTHKLHVLNGGYFTGEVLGETNTLTSSGDLTVTGSTVLNESVQIDGGTFAVSGSGASLAAPDIVVSSGAALQADNSSQLAYTVLSGAGTVNVADFVNAPGSTVAGTLTFTGNFTNTGTFAPGNSPGITTILGNYTESGTLDMELGGLAGPGVVPDGFDQVRVGGTAAAAGGTLNVRGYNGFAPARGQTFALIADTTGGAKVVNGTFAAVLFDLDGIAGPGAPIQNAAGVLDLRTGRFLASGLNAPGSAFSELGASGNERALIAAVFGGAQIAPNQIDSDTTEGRAAEDILTSSAATSSATLATYIPESYAALADYTTASGRMVQRLSDRVSPFAALPGTKNGDGAFYAATATSEADTSHDARYTRTDFYAGTDFLLGKDIDIGVFGAGDTGNVRYDAGKTEVQGFTVGAYTVIPIAENWSLKGAFSYGEDDFDMKRRTLHGAVKADTSAENYTGSLTVQYVAFRNESFSIAPRVAFLGTSTSVSGFTESGASDALHIGSYDTERYSARLGASAVWTTRLFGNPLSLELTGDVDQAFSDSQDNLDASFAATPGVRYPIMQNDNRSTSFIYGVNAGYGITDAVSLYLGYQGRAGYTPSNDFQVSVRVRF